MGNTDNGILPTTMGSEMEMRNSEEEYKDKLVRSGSSSPSMRSDEEPFLTDKPVDVEAQNEPSNTPHEHQVPFKTKLLFLGIWFSLNLGLTMSNKAVMTRARYPWLLTAMQTSATSMGCFGMFGMGRLQLSDLSRKDNLIMVAFSFLFTFNIAISNVSLSMVSLPFHQILRSTCPVATIVIYRLVYSRTYSRSTYLSMIPLIAGCVMATAGDKYYTFIGLILTILGVILAAVKTVATNRLMTGSLSLPALEVLVRMSPLAATQCIVYSFWTGELSQFRTEFQQNHFSAVFWLMVIGNGAMAFVLNIVSFQANKKAGALSMTVAGNVKQALTILIGIVVFQVQTQMLSAVGMAVTLAGAAWYSKVELDTKRART